MPIDPTIALQARPIQLPNPMEIQQQAMTLRDLNMRGQLQQAQLNDVARANADRQTLADLYRKNVDSSGTVNATGMLSGLAASGMGDKIPAYTKSLADAQEASTKAFTAQFDLHKKVTDAIASTYGALASNPNVTHDDVISAFSSLVDQYGGAIPPEQAAKAVRDLPGPQQLRGYLMQKAMQAQDASKQMEALLPKPYETNLGGTVEQGTIDPVTGARTPVRSVARTVSPDTTAALNAGVTYQVDENGHIIGLPTKPKPGAPVVSTPVVDAAGKPVTSNTGGKLTETQGKATTFAARMQDAENTIGKLEKQGVSGSDLRTMAAGSGFTNWLASPEGQEYRQAQENWVTANLRQESGAAIGKDEMAKDIRKFFPAVGDSPAVIEQKSRARQVAQRGMMMQAGPGAKEVPGIVGAPASPAATPPGALSVPPDIAAILQKHGGK
jgi:hypothetical protein